MCGMESSSFFVCTHPTQPLTRGPFHSNQQRQEYHEFLEDRLRTVKKLRDLEGDMIVILGSILDPAVDCLRGLEPFQSAFTHQDMHTKRRFHQTTILLEQLRQAKLGIRDPERFLLLVSAQSEMALMKAQELAAIDQHDVHHTVGRRGSMITNMVVRNHTNYLAGVSSMGVGLNKSHNNNNSNRSIPLDERIRTLQEMNARKLMQIYQQPWSRFSSRFPIRRDSLFGSNVVSLGGGGSNGTGNGGLTTLGTSTTGQAMVLPIGSMRFPLRRDSLGVAPHLLS
jgi:hypothetical protein